MTADSFDSEAQRRRGRTTRASAPGKIILFGEHAVVYGRPAIAAPVGQVRATAEVVASSVGQHVLNLPDLDLVATTDDVLFEAVVQVEAYLSAQLPPLEMTVRSAIPIASGMGSGAATAAALIRALLLHMGAEAAEQTVCDLTFAVEKLHHGTPSGIDNTVVAFEQPVFFVRAEPHNRIEPFHIKRPLQLLIGDTGVRSSTMVTVGDVRRLWEEDSAEYNTYFTQIAQITLAARTAIENGELVRLGQLMNENHAVLQKMTVSSAELDTLVAAALAGGALGAKLSGGGRGGNMIALVDGDSADKVHQSLLKAGAKSVLSSTIGVE